MRHVNGFTLVELLAVLAIVSIFAAVGVPSLGSYIESGRLRSAAFDLVADLAFARSEAIKRNAQVVVTQATAGSWTDGWRVRAGTGSTAPVLRDRSGSLDNLVISTAATQFVFNGSGRLDGGTDATLRLCTDDGATGRSVLVGPSGLARSTKASCS